MIDFLLTERRVFVLENESRQKLEVFFCSSLKPLGLCYSQPEYERKVRPNTAKRSPVGLAGAEQVDSATFATLLRGYIRIIAGNG